MKLGAIPTLVLLVISIYIAIPSESNIVFMFIDNISASYCPDVLFCAILPQLKLMTNIIGMIGAFVSGLSLIGQIFRREWFFAKEKKNT